MQSAVLDGLHARLHKLQVLDPNVIMFSMCINVIPLTVFLLLKDSLRNSNKSVQELSDSMEHCVAVFSVHNSE